MRARDGAPPTSSEEGTRKRRGRVALEPFVRTLPGFGCSARTHKVSSTVLLCKSAIGGERKASLSSRDGTVRDSFLFHSFFHSFPALSDGASSSSPSSSPPSPDHLPRSAVVISGGDQRFSGAIFCLLVPSPGVPSPGAIGGGEDLGRSSHVLLLLPANLEALEGTVLVTCDCHLVASRLVSSRLEVSISRLLLHRSCAPLPQAIICMWMTLTGHYGKLGMV